MKCFWSFFCYICFVTMVIFSMRKKFFLKSKIYFFCISIRLAVVYSAFAAANGLMVRDCQIDFRVESQMDPCRSEAEPQPHHMNERHLKSKSFTKSGRLRANKTHSTPNLSKIPTIFLLFKINSITSKTFFHFNL